MKLREKLIELDCYAKNHTVKEVISKSEELFPKDEYEEDYVNEAYYSKNQVNIILPETRNSKIAINYPGGDRFGNKISDPETSISIVFEDENLESKWMCIIDDEEGYNDNSKLLEKLDQILSNKTYSREEIMTLLQKEDENVWRNLTPDLKEDNEIVALIVEMIEDEARELVWNSEYELDFSEQFFKLCENYAENNPNDQKIINELYKAHYNNSNFIDKYNTELEKLVEDWCKYQYLLKNKIKYLEYYQNVHDSLNKQKGYLESVSNFEAILWDLTNKKTMDLIFKEENAFLKSETSNIQSLENVLESSLSQLNNYENWLIEWLEDKRNIYSKYGDESKETKEFVKRLNDINI